MFINRLFDEANEDVLDEDDILNVPKQFKKYVSY